LAADEELHEAQARHFAEIPVERPHLRPTLICEAGDQQVAHSKPVTGGCRFERPLFHAIPSIAAWMENGERRQCPTQPWHLAAAYPGEDFDAHWRSEGDLIELELF